MSSLFENALISNRCGLAALTFLACEYFAQLPREVELFWKRKGRVNAASVLLLSNRYLSLLSEVIQNAAIGPISDQVRRSLIDRINMSYGAATEVISGFSCATLNNATITIAVLPYFSWAAFSALRTYALCRPGVGLFLGMFVFLLSSVPIAINLARYRWLGSVIIPPLGCFAQVNVSEDLYKASVTIASRTCLIVADLIVLGTTLRATYRTTQMTRVSGQPGMRTFSGTLFRDGVIYFFILLTLNVLHLLFTMLSISFDSLTSISYVTIFTDPITAVLISRFILDLQAVNSRRTDPQLTTIKFTQVLGSLGSSLPSPIDKSFAEDWDGLGFEDYNLEEADKDIHALEVVARTRSRS